MEKLFQYAVIWHPNEEQQEKGEKSKLIVPITTKLSSSEDAVKMVAVRAIPAEYDEALEQLTVVVRPF